MTLANLLAIQRLQAFEPTAQGVQRLLAAAERNLDDAGIAQLSPETRFDAAYKCILQCAMLGLWAQGYRTSTSQPGHHQTALQALPLSMGLPNDVVIVLGVFALFQWPVDLTVLAALLALIGYSINDSIVVADYVRDMFRTTRLNDPAEIVNSAIQLTLGRTVNTSLTTLLVVLALQFFGGEAVHSFSLALSIGIIVGTYSSIYIVCNLALAMKLDKEDFIVPIVEEVDEAP